MNKLPEFVHPSDPRCARGYRPPQAASELAPLEAKLSPHAKHAYETYTIAFWRESNTMTIREMRDAIRALYGDAVDQEIEEHLKERREEVYPR